MDAVHISSFLCSFVRTTNVKTPLVERNYLEVAVFYSSLLFTLSHQWTHIVVNKAAMLLVNIHKNSRMRSSWLPTQLFRCLPYPATIAHPHPMICRGCAFVGKAMLADMTLVS